MKHPYAAWIVATLAVLCPPAVDAQSPRSTDESRPTASDLPTWLERWLFNPEERTERAMASFEAGHAGDAVEPLETALRLKQGHPLAQYNAGAARLGAGKSDAESLLESAAESGSEALAPLAHYNLGNARLAANDFQGAITAYQQALRLDPALEDAKFNLELARRWLQEQPQEPQDQQQQDPQDQQRQDPQDQQQQDPQDQQQRDQQQQDQRQELQQQDPEPQPEENPQQRSQDRPLPQFRDLPDMTAEEAAAILEAIENLEREERRQEAIEAAKKHRRGKKDW